ncbi:hypothetical protein L2E82_47360 [Cichorium intybus]|uniref:Uncharacterized protein n=1 Tax=Cichorium intybus TaxID=13427 RepID=A0ACB8YVL2_CICIN|nr:hypothetical protein L2E82_47360 [Cichorium intybus]
MARRPPMKLSDFNSCGSDFTAFKSRGEVNMEEEAYPDSRWKTLCKLNRSRSLLHPPYSQIGRVFYKHPIRFLDSSFNSTVSFYTSFSFTIVPPPPPCPPGEGIAFLITSESNSLPQSVGSIGLPKSIDQNSLDSSTSESASSSIEVEAVGSENCLICFPDDPVKEEHKTPVPNNHHKDKRVLQLALGLLALNLILILLTVSFVVFYVCVTKRRNQMQNSIEQGQIRTFQEKRMPRRLELSMIRSATKGFSRNQIISQRPSATVYEANLPPYGNVAVKRFRHVNKTGSFDGQFATDFATMVGSLTHKNLMQLQGWCCDFGMAELYEHSSRAREATVPAGTMGYLAPEYVYSGVPTVKTDVYSFGVLVLEVASGRRPVDENGVMVTDWVWDLWEDKELVAAADPNLMGRFHRMDMEMMLMAGLICVHPNYEMRPTMKEAMQMLQGGLVPDLPATKPTVMIRSVNFDRSPEVVVRCGVDEGMTSWGTPKSHFSKQ